MLKYLAEASENSISEEFKKYKKEALVLEIYETFPLLLLHDGYYFINCCLSKEAWTSLQAQIREKEMKLSDMQMYRLAIENFKL